MNNKIVVDAESQRARHALHRIFREVRCLSEHGGLSAQHREVLRVIQQVRNNGEIIF